MLSNLKIIGFRFVFIFTLVFISSLTFPFYLFPNIGGAIGAFFEPINTLWANSFGVNNGASLCIVSDSIGLYLHLITLTLISGLGAIIWWLFSKSKSITIQNWFHTSVAYYLALILFKYGFDKVFKHQFYLPEPNTLYTPLGQLSPDILFWSSMGSSYEYSIFSGLIELVPAILLLFRKTRLLGGLIAIGVLTNVVMINFGFDISVKVYSIFLWVLSLIVIAPNFKALTAFFFSNTNTKQQIEPVRFKSKKQLLGYAITKSVIIGLIIFESLGGFFEIGNFNDDTYPRPYLHGAYSVTQKSIENGEDIKRVFFHRKQYFIIQYTNDKFESYELAFSDDLKQLILVDEVDDKFILDFQYTESKQELIITGKLATRFVYIVTYKESLENLPFFD